MSRHRIGGRSNWRDRPAARHGAQPHVPGVPDDQPGMFPDLGEPVHAAPPPPPPPPPPAPPPPPTPAPPSRSNPSEAGAVEASPWSIFTNKFAWACLFGVVFAEVLNILRLSDWAESFRLVGGETGRPSLGAIVVLLAVVLGLISGISHAIHDNTLAKTKFEVGAALFPTVGLLLWLLLMRAPAVGAPPVVVKPQPPPTQEAPKGAFTVPERSSTVADADEPTIPPPDDSDAEHLGTRRNVAMAVPGQRVKHPVLVKNEGSAWWRNRSLCRERGQGDSPAVRSVDQCIQLDTVPPRESVEVTLEVVAPLLPGRYIARWKMVGSDGATVFPDAEPITLHVVVR